MICLSHGIFIIIKDKLKFFISCLNFYKLVGIIAKILYKTTRNSKKFNSHFLCTKKKLSVVEFTDTFLPCPGLNNK